MTDMPSDMLAHNRKLIEEFRTAGAPEGRPLLLLTTTGRRSGESRTSPLMYIPDGERLLIVASNAGAERDPLWFGNLDADPRVHVEVGAESYDATAMVLDGDERDEVFARIAADYPFFNDHQAKVTRPIPVVALVRA